VIDRTNGQVLSAKPYIHLNEILGIEMKTGRPKMNPDLTPAPGKTLVGICPNQLGGKDWEPSSYSPRTGYVYIPTIDLCMNWYSYKVAYIAGTPYVGAALDSYTPPGTNYRGEFQAWDPIKQKQVWSIHEKFPVFSGTMVTSGDVAFYGTLDRWFKAVDAKTGKVLWKFRAPAGIMGQPVTYEVNGVQYVAILCGPGGGIAGITIAKLNPRIRNAALGTVGATQDLPEYTAGGGTLLVFALPASMRKAMKSHPSRAQTDDPSSSSPKGG
jgi:alcohol dehydrogenase (cytochrome c)